MKRTLFALLVLSLALAGCKAKEAYDKAKISQDLSKRGTLDLMKDVSNDNYTPPADGKLTDAQVQMYLKVRGHEKDIVQVAKAEAQKHAAAADKAGEKSIAGFVEGLKTMGSAADMLTADIRAAKDLGYNTQEYLWVKAQVLGVSTTAMAEKLQQSMSASIDVSYKQMKKAYDEAKDDQTRSMYKQMLDSYEQQRKESAAAKAEESPALAYNRQLLSKYEDKPGSVQKSMDEFQKSVDKATEDAKKQ